ncbi:AAA domain-containing protein [Desulfomicrobium apsheronum]|uniref:AAA domain-containing protein n=1 Tax=Desulfomicrobium apsheronum TaxID=52560 RepID=A0A1I4AFZ9_9BACT|nr:AAA family ATPase [Desulfomicrobium apsheronum]SFK54967.1 AAA domain-containing protein [Desulfomicrobium apsheronum]
MNTQIKNPAGGPGFKVGAEVIQQPQENLEAISQNCQEKTEPVVISRYTSGDTLTKSFSLVDGKLVKRPGGHMTSGQVERVTVACPEDLAGKVLNLTTHQALGFGLSAHNIARIVAQGMLDRIPQNASMPVIARTAQNITFTKGKPGVLMADVDAPKDGRPPLTREQALALIISVCPEFARAPMLICDSASSHIWNSETGEQLVGARGLRIYVFVSDASDIPRAGKVLVNKLSLAGHGYIQITAAGTMKEDGPLDAAVWQGERLDFAAGAACEPPLEQRRPAPEVRNNDAPPLDTRRALPPLTTKQEAELHRLVQAAKEKARPEAARIREQWLDSRVDAELAREGKTSATHPKEAQATRTQLAAAAATSILHKEFILYLKDGQSVTVEEVLANREKYDGARCADPLEPSYGNDDRIGLIILNDGDARVFSHAHGGQVYYLEEVKKAEPAPRFQLLNRDGIMALSDPEWIIKLIFPTRGLVVIHGLSTVGKSFLAFDMGCHIAEGRKFFGHRVKQRPVVYVCLEGEAGFKRRVQAWEQHHGRIIPDQLFLVKDTFDIREPQDIDGLTAIIPDGAVVIIDTLNRCAPGAEENGSVDMGLIINGAKEIERRTSGLVAFVAHPGKDESRGIRGHSSLFAALDGNIEVVAKGDRFMWTARKVKDGPGGGEYFFKRDVVTLGEDEDGDPITSCVIVPDFAPSQKERRLSPGMKLGLETFMAALGNTEGEAGVQLDTWREHFYCASTADTSEAKKKSFLRARKDLVEAGILAVTNDFYVLNESNRDTGHCRDTTGTLSRQGGFLPGHPGHHPKGCVPCPAPHGDRTGTFVEMVL